MKKKKLFEDDKVFGKSDVLPLSQVPKDAAKAAIGSGTKDGDPKDDSAPGKKVSVPASSLQAAQTEIIPEKALGMAIAMINKVGKFSSGPGGDLESIISADNYIMDGHHRWAATYLADPGASITATQIDLPGKALVSALNVVTVGQFGRGGNQGKGDIKGFTGNLFDKLLDDWLKNGYSDGGNTTKPEDVKTALETLGGGDVEAGKKQIMSNADKLPKTIMPGAPARVEMPVINGSEVASVAKAIAAGEIDIKEPYSDDVKDKMESYYQMRRGLKPLRESVIKKLKDYNTKNKNRLQESFLKKVKKQKLEEKLTELIKPMILETLKKIVKNKKR
jgi:hypothetical protein